MSLNDLHRPLAFKNGTGPARGPSRSPSGTWARWLSRVVPVLLIPLVLAGMVEAVDEAMVPAPVDLVAPSMVAALPLHQNERVDRWAERFRTTQRPAFQRLLHRKGAYEELIRDKLRQRQMPEELLYLSMMEGGFKPRARSAASAVGLWQFMGPTAKQYGLRVDEWVDERRDPVRSTDAALEYLSWLHERYGSWYLAAAAYNAGPGRIDRVLRRYAAGRTGDESIYWEILEHLPLETREYVPRLVAATLVAEEAEAEGFDMELVQPYRYDRVFVPGATSLTRVARILEVEAGTLRALNPHLVRGVTPPNQAYPVRVPVGDSHQVVASVKGRTRGRVLN